MIIGMVVITLAGEDHLPFHLAPLAELVEHGFEASGQVNSAGVAQVDQRPHQLRPAGLDLEDERDDQRGPGQPHGDVPKEAEVAGAVDPGRFEQLPRQAEEELPEQEDI